MSPRPDVSDERKSQILNAAEEVFTEKGFDQARMEDIADQTGLSKGTLYLYFKSKDDLIIAILDRLFQREFGQMEKLVVADRTARACVEEFTDLATRDVSAMLRLLPIFYQFLALAFRNKYVQHALKQYLNSFLDILTPIIQRGIDSGEFRAVDAREVALAAGAIFEGTILLWIYDKTAVDPVRNIHSSIRLLMDGVMAP
jgi:AcrR family transcriptional regulator